MQYFIILLISTFGMAIGELAKRALLAIGFGTVTYVGINVILDQIEQKFTTASGDLPTLIINMLGILQIDTCFTMFVSAAVIKQVIQGWNKLTDTRSGRVWHPPGTGGSQPM